MKIFTLTTTTTCFHLLLLPRLVVSFGLTTGPRWSPPLPTTATTTTTSLSLSTTTPTTATTTVNVIDTLKDDLTRACLRTSKPLLEEVQSLVQDLEEQAEQVGVGQASSLSGLLAGEWELLYSPEDVTRSSPFFWAFRRAFPEQSDQIFGITDAIPAPIKQVGPAYQTITMEDTNIQPCGELVSRVKVATLNGMATSIMTTKASIMGVEGVDGIRLQIETTKPEESTVLQTLLGPLFATVNNQIPAFPSGEALERVQPGSSQVVMRTTFCDEGLRISRNEDAYGDVYVWRRRNFDTVERL